MIMNDAVSINIDNDPTCYEYEQQATHEPCKHQVKNRQDMKCTGKCLPVCSCLSGTLVDGTVVPAADRVY